MEQTGNYKHYLRPQNRGIKLHLGCGDYWFDGYINIDINIYGGTDMLWDIRKTLPFQPEVVEIIEAYEVVEHLNKHELFNILEDWKRVLISGGVIRISVPDMDELIKLYQIDTKKALEEIYGLEDHPHHKQGFTLDSLRDVFSQHGFREVKVIKGAVPERPNECKLILECIK